MKNHFEIKRMDLDKSSIKWDSIISSSYPCTFFHTASWLNIIERSYNLKGFHFVLLHQGEPILTLPMFRSKIALHSPYMADYGGACLNRSVLNNDSLVKEAFESLYREIMKIARENKVAAIYVRGFYNNKIQDDTLIRTGFFMIMKHLTYVLSDFYDVKDTLSIFDRNARRAVRKAIKMNVEAESISPDSEVMDEFIRLHLITKDKYNSEPFPHKFFKLLSTIPPKNVDIIMAKHKDIYIAGLLSFSYQGVTHIFDPCSDPNYYKLNPNNLLYYTLIEKAKKGRMEVDFGRTSPEHEGLRQFKERWGGKKYSYNTFRIILPPAYLNTLRLGIRSVRRHGIKGTLDRRSQRRK